MLVYSTVTWNPTPQNLEGGSAQLNSKWQLQTGNETSLDQPETYFVASLFLQFHYFAVELSLFSEWHPLLPESRTDERPKRRRGLFLPMPLKITTTIRADSTRPNHQRLPETPQVLQRRPSHLIISGRRATFEIKLLSNGWYFKFQVPEGQTGIPPA